MVSEPDQGNWDEWTGTSEEELEKYAGASQALIKVFGVGGGGSNTINRLFKKAIPGVDLIACNTDARHLRRIRSNYKILLGENVTKGWGTGGDPRAGEAAARESEQEILNYMQGGEIVFVTTGLGGGTGTGAAPVIASIAKEHGAITISVVTMPFETEGKERERNALVGYRKLKQASDTVIAIPNEKLLKVNPDVPFEQGFEAIDEIVIKAISAVTEVITRTERINLDLNDLKEIVKNSKEAMIGIGVGEGDPDKRASEALKNAINSPFLDVDFSTAKGVILNVTGGTDLQLTSANHIVDEVKKLVANDARIILGVGIDPAFAGKIQVTLIVTGVLSDASKKGENLGNDDEVDFIS
ncbi:MAG: cell division protein FtsZ [Candidatus Thermoplasmatota archaeon]|nr:cell division protein FtsZ [Candidatus Thermoplasmatota archaeon]MCL5730828.1 cell division protein FtsZ [Candidatus Thermoplasmatota archaeon]